MNENLNDFLSILILLSVPMLFLVIFLRNLFNHKKTKKKEKTNQRERNTGKQKRQTRKRKKKRKRRKPK